MIWFIIQIILMILLYVVLGAHLENTRVIETPAIWALYGSLFGALLTTLILNGV